MRFSDYNNIVEEEVDLDGEVLKFVSNIQRSIISNNKQREPSNYYSPSSMRCARNMYYKRKGVKTESSWFPYYMVGITQVGEFRHEKLQNIISNLKYKQFEWIDIQEYLAKKELDNIEFKGYDGVEAILRDKKNMISFRCDGLIKLGDTYLVLEIKTETQDKFKAREAVAREHSSQITSYCNSLDVDKALFIYENRSNCIMKAFVVNVTEKDKLELRDKIAYTENCYQTGVLPKAEPSKENCQYCRYKIKCGEGV